MKRVLLLLAGGFEALEGAAFSDVLGWADTYGVERIEVVTAALHERLRCTFGVTVMPDVLVTDVNVETFDALAIPGGFETSGFYQDAYAPAFLEIIQQFHVAGKPIATIGVGALPVARSGILKGKRATTYHLRDGLRRRQLAEMGAIVVDARLVRDENVITSTSPATAIDVALELLAELTSPENARKIRILMGFEL
jgi:protein deglycase